MSESNRNRGSSYGTNENWEQNQEGRYDQHRHYSQQHDRNQRQRYGNNYENTGSSYDDRGQFRYGSDFDNENSSRQYNQGGMGNYGNNSGRNYGSGNYGSNYGANYGASHANRFQNNQESGYGNAYGQSGQYDRRHEYQGGYGNMGGDYGSTWGNQYNQSQQYGQGNQGNNRGEERGWWDKTRDEVSSWFGDTDAERRRRRDEMVSGQHRGKGPRDYRRSDDRIREDVCDRLSDDSYVDASDIEVKVDGSEVTLTGTVDSREAKRRAEDLVESISGVNNVQNHLRVNNRSGSQSEGLRTPIGK